jgi:N utilization substance protein A
MAARKTKSTKADRTELIEALNAIEKEKQISKDIILEAIENSLLAACKNQFGKSENIRVNIDRETGEVKVFADYEVVEDDMIEDDALQIGITEAKLRFRDDVEVGEKVSTEVTPKNFGRIAAQKAKQVVVQKIREEERKVLYVQYLEKEREVITGIVQRYSGKNVCINLGRVDAILMESEQVRGEHFRPTEHIKLYVVEVKDTPKGPRITVSRSHPEFVKRLFEEEVTEIQDGIVTIESIAREAGSRTKIAVSTVDPNVDAVGACVGMNGSRVNAIVNELRGEKIDIVNWSDMPEIFIENALSPAMVMDVSIDEYEKTARVIVPENQLSLAIGKEGQNARLAAKLTGYKIDIKCE